MAAGKTMRDSVKFTVIIPTRESAGTLAHCLRTVTEQAYDNLEIIVSDNFSGDGTRELVSGWGDKRVKYLNTGRRLGMSQNFEFALSRVKTGWIAVLGDDDGLLPGALAKAAALIRGSRTQALMSDACLYAWPSLTGESYGRLSVPLGAGSEKRDAGAWLGRVLDGRANYTALPMLYTGGFVSAALVERVRARSGGTFFRSRIPDVYSAMALASAAGRYLYSRAPLALTGLSRRSNGLSYLGFGRDWLGRVFGPLPRAKVRAAVAPVKAFLAEKNLPFHPDLPLGPDGAPPRSLQALVYESWLQSAHLRRGRPGAERGQLDLVLRASVPQGPRRNDCARAGSRRLPLKNVCEAALAAGLILDRAAGGGA